MLPKLSHPTFETKIPSTGAAIKYRPFLVKEHKTLMKAVEFNDETNLIETFKNLVNECTFETVDVSKLPMFDVEYLFLKIKGCSTGSRNSVKYVCDATVDDGKCAQAITLNLDTENAVLTVPPAESLIIMLDDKGAGIRMRYPTFEDYIKRGGAKTLSELSEEFTLDCVEMVFDANAVYTLDKDYTRNDLRKFMDELSEDAADRIASFIETIPQVEMRVKIRCPKCGNEDELHLVGLDDFLE